MGISVINAKRRAAVTTAICAVAIIVGIVFFRVQNPRRGPDGPNAGHDVAKGDPIAERRERALQLINHINFVIYKISSCNDSVVLEEEYKLLNPSSLRLDVIDDKETIDTIRQLLDFLVDMRIDSKEREFLEQDREDAMSDLLKECLPDPSSCISANPWVAATKVAGAAFTAFNSYARGKKKIEKQFARKNWELDKNKLICLNELNKSLLVNHWNLVKKYNMDDMQRVTEEDIALLMNKLKDSDARRKYQFLVNPDHEKTYKKSPLYWYYRASAAHENGDWQGVIEAAHRYEAIYLQILRHDRVAALVASLKLNALLRINPPVDGMNVVFDDKITEIRRTLDVIDENARYEDWNLLYLSACLRYSMCGDYDLAQRRMSDLVDHLASAEENRFRKWRGLLSKDKERKSNRDKAAKELDELQEKRKEQQEKGKGLSADEYKRLDDLTASLVDYKMDELTVGSKPKVEPLYICRTALMKMRCGHMTRDEVESAAKGILDAENTSSHERLFLYGLVRTKDIENKVKGEFEKVSISLSTFPGREDFIHVKMPYSWFLIPSHFEIVFMAGNRQIVVLSEERSNREIIRDKEDAALRFRQELDELPHSVDRVMLRFVDSELNFRAFYSIPKKTPDSPVSGCTLTFERVEVLDKGPKK